MTDMEKMSADMTAIAATLSFMLHSAFAVDADPKATGENFKLQLLRLISQLPLQTKKPEFREAISKRAAAIVDNALNVRQGPVN